MCLGNLLFFSSKRLFLHVEGNLDNHAVFFFIRKPELLCVKFMKDANIYQFLQQPSFAKNNLWEKCSFHYREQNLCSKIKSVSNLSRRMISKEDFPASKFILYRKFLWRLRNQFWQMSMKFLPDSIKKFVRHQTVEEKIMFFSRSLFFFILIVCARWIRLWKTCGIFFRNSPIFFAQSPKVAKTVGFFFTDQLLLKTFVCTRRMQFLKQYQNFQATIPNFSCSDLENGKKLKKV